MSTNAKISGRERLHVEHTSECMHVYEIDRFKRMIETDRRDSMHFRRVCFAIVHNRRFLTNGFVTTRSFAIESTDILFSSTHAPINSRRDMHSLCVDSFF